MGDPWCPGRARCIKGTVEIAASPMGLAPWKLWPGQQAMKDNYTLGLWLFVIVELVLL